MHCKCSETWQQDNNKVIFIIFIMWYCPFLTKSVEKLAVAKSSETVTSGALVAEVFKAPNISPVEV